MYDVLMIKIYLMINNQISYSMTTYFPTYVQKFYINFFHNFYLFLNSFLLFRHTQKKEKNLLLWIYFLLYHCYIHKYDCLYYNVIILTIHSFIYSNKAKGIWNGFFFFKIDIPIYIYIYIYIYIKKIKNLFVICEKK